VNGSAERLADDSITAASVVSSAHDDPPSRARVVVIGGGIIGASVAYHLAEVGVTDAVLVERGSVSCGTTWHPAGLLANARATHALTELARHSVDVYARIGGESGIPNGFNRRGSLAVARRPERMTELRYSAAIARHHGIEGELLSAREVAERVPLVSPDGLEGGLLFAVDGTTNPGASALGLVKVAHERGVAVREGVTVEGIDLRDGSVQAVLTNRGRIECEAAVLCTGLW
jgi:glycine/D-amino acid oxidase-like deaminating enzyme